MTKTNVKVRLKFKGIEKEKLEELKSKHKWPFVVSDNLEVILSLEEVFQLLRSYPYTARHVPMDRGNMKETDNKPSFDPGKSTIEFVRSLYERLSLRYKNKPSNDEQKNHGQDLEDKIFYFYIPVDLDAFVRLQNRLQNVVFEFSYVPIPICFN
jgi:hypothetical protein